MRNLAILLAAAALLCACQSTEAPSAPSPSPIPAAEETAGEQAVQQFSVSKVSAVASPPAVQSYEHSMQGAKPGEVRGFVNPDSDTAYALLSNGEITFLEFAEYVFNKKEGLDLSPAELKQAALQLAKQNSSAVDPDDSPPANKLVVCELKLFVALFKPNKGAVSSTKSSPSVTATSAPAPKTKVTSSGPSSSGLNIDD